MLHTFTTKGSRRYGYYTCSTYHNKGAEKCPRSRVQAGEFEKFVAQQIQRIGRDEGLLAQTVSAATGAGTARYEKLTRELRRLERAGAAGTRSDEIRAELRVLGDGVVDEDDLRDALAAFTPVWTQLFPREQERILRLLIETITYDPGSGDVEFELRPCGIQVLADETREAS